MPSRLNATAPYPRTSGHFGYPGPLALVFAHQSFDALSDYKVTNNQPISQTKQ